MNKFYNFFHRRFLVFLTIVIIVTLGLTSAGCEPLRKKFARKKKQERRDEIIPLLEPVEYPQRTYSSEGLYRQHYSLWQVWHKDLMNSLAENDSDKRVIYILSQLMVQLEAMGSLLDGAGKSLADKYMDRLSQLKEAYSRPAGMRNEFSLESQARQIDKQVREELSLKKVRDSLRPVETAGE